MTYITTRVKKAPPIKPLRSKTLDWQELTPAEQSDVSICLRDELPIRALSVRSQVFIRRYYDGV